MSRDPVLLPPAESELARLVELMCDGTIVSHERDRLELLLEKDQDARLFYIAYLDVHAQMLWLMRGEEETPENDPFETADAGGPATVTDEATFPSSSALPPAPSVPAPVGFLSDALPGTAGFFSSGWPMAYGLATVITALVLWIFSVIQVTAPEQIARHADSLPSPLSPLPSVVGRITGMADCQWEEKGAGDRGQGTENQKSEIRNQKSPVPLGQKYALASGLMEITFDSGASVILQGPAIFESDVNGGYLSLGKLTGRMEKKVESGEWRVERTEEISKSPNPSLSTLHSPLFTIRTPTATVTDLGTEFGIEVGRDGVTETHVLAGSVKIVNTGRGGSAGADRIIRAGNAVRVGGKGNPFEAIRPVEEKFVRAVPRRTKAAEADAYADLVLSMNPVAYYRMERRSNADDEVIVFDSAPGGHHGMFFPADKELAWSALRLGGRYGRMLHLGDRNYVVVRNLPGTETNQLAFTAWVNCWDNKVTGIASQWHPGASRNDAWQFGIGTWGSDGDLGAGVHSRNGEHILVREGEGHPLPLFTWQHIAVVADGAAVRIYRNGREVAAKPCDGVFSAPVVNCLTIGCQDMRASPDVADIQPGQFWAGDIDEMAIFNHALSPGEVQRLFQGPAAAGTTAKGKP